MSSNVSRDNATRAIGRIRQVALDKQCRPATMSMTTVSIIIHMLLIVIAVMIIKYY